MCGITSREDSNEFRAFRPPSEELVARTRAIEAAMQGGLVPEAQWTTFFGADCGAIAWQHFERMFSARKAAASYLAINARAADAREPRRRQSKSSISFRCIPD